MTQHSHKIASKGTKASQECLKSQLWEDGDRRILGDSLPTSPAKSASSSLMRNPVSKNKTEDDGRRYLALTFDLYMHIFTCTHTIIYMHTSTHTLKK